jgi:predicted transcriptional regulator
MHYMAKETMSIRVRPEVRDALDSVAAAEDRDRTWVVNEALTAYLETRRWQIEHIQQGLREAEAGRFVSAGTAKKTIDRLRRR